MVEGPALTVRFWGVRGSIACPSPSHMVFGGNTSCLEVRAGERILILDAGTGIRPLGQILKREGATEADILFSHTHWDHVNGFPFFAPAFEPGCTFRVFAGHLAGEGGIREAIAGHMHEPMFPVPLDVMRARLKFTDFPAGETLDLGPGLRARTAPLNHPNGATAYRIEHRGRSICYVTDTEHVPGRPDERVLELIAGADLVVYDSTYTDAGFPARVGWGHSTWQEGLRLLRRAGAKRLAVFHHDPDHDDEAMSAIERELASESDGNLVAREGLRLDLAGAAA
ncbi:MAG TPA: MBL fold metallo-hydrolase [Vicinamibacteria bacterium]|nr:MBL fold metallo-hydrolase [Vicinamibacteria bacterium]